MTSSGQKVCLSMIVKNEARVILRCLDSVRAVIDHWVIVDTCSTDGTQDIIRTAMSDVPGTLLERPWVDFGHNRTEALELARPHGDYTLVIDADDELITAQGGMTIPADYKLPNLDAPGYTLQIHDTTMRYPRTQLFKNAFPWRYRGVLHEFAECKELVWTDTLPLAMRRGHDGARRRDESTYVRDAELFEKALKIEKDPFLLSRYTYYLANSYRDCGEKRKALQAYLHRTTMGFWEEEIYISYLGAALLMDNLGDPFDEVIACFDKAIAINPRRVEAMYYVSRYCQDKQRYVEAYHYAESGLGLSPPTEGLFVQHWMYNYGLMDKFSVIAFNTGQYRACLSACIGVLGCPEFPHEERQQRVEIARKALNKMVDPAWGANHSSYSAVYSPDW
ncbi:MULTISPECIES: glycosyltransferase [unclassified Methylobacterium]|uniref:glycosyltransferase n=1 Tax=unclassified Methylobacterium TaxID=2615210 RepID=UPI0011C1F3E3|nr:MULTISPECIES: glycosyltransferase [unclassified Methylobacterium]QEE37767.1 glycosyltransferase [Methylobacterium sp. WL1]TXN56234.1 glycosyltransferase [Methylobacterium sp. WL2]